MKTELLLIQISLLVPEGTYIIINVEETSLRQYQLMTLGTHFVLNNKLKEQCRKG